jgi:hypothetical protein
MMAFIMSIVQEGYLNKSDAVKADMRSADEYTHMMEEVLGGTMSIRANAEMSALYERAYDDSRLAAQTVAPEIGNRTDIRLLASEGRDQVSFGELKRLVLDLEETNEY